MAEGIEHLRAQWPGTIEELARGEGAGEVGLDVALEGARVRVVGRAGAAETRVTASAPGFEGLVLRAFGESALWSLGKLLGAQDITLGAPAFDARYVVQSNDAAFARLALSVEVCEAIGAIDGPAERAGYVVGLEAGVVSLSRRGLEPDVGRLERAVRAAAALARRGAEVLAELRLIAAAIGGEVPERCAGWAPDGGAPIVVRHGGAPARVEQVFTTFGGLEPRLWTRVWVARTAALKDAVVVHRKALELDRHRIVVPALREHHDEVRRGSYVVLAEDAELVDDRLRLRADASLLAARPDALVLDRDAIAAWFEGFVADGERLRNAVGAVRRALATDLETMARIMSVPQQMAEGRWAPWHDAALAVGGRFLHAAGDRPEMILAEIDGTLVKASASRGEGGLVTRIMAATSGTGGLSFSVLEAGRGPDDRDLRQRDVVFEEPDFDRRFAVWCDAPEFALLWLTPEVRRFLLDCYDPSVAASYELEVSGEQVTLTKAGVEDEAGRLVRAMKVVAAYARRGVEVLAMWRELAGRLGGELDPGLPCWRPDGIATIAIDGVEPRFALDHQTAAPWLEGPGLFTRVRAISLGGGPGRFALCSPMLSAADLDRLGRSLGEVEQLPDEIAAPYVAVAEFGEELGRWLDADVMEVIEAIEPEVVVGTGPEVTIWLAGFVDDPEILHAAIKVAAALCSSELHGAPAGPYR